MLGYASEREVTMADMLHHTAAAARGIKTPFFSPTCRTAPPTTRVRPKKTPGGSSKRGRCVKLEGWREKSGVIAHLTKKNIPVCAHIGYNPQIHGARPKVFGADRNEARVLIESARLLEQAGAVLLIVEKVPEEVAGIIAGSLRIPVIGIGSGGSCDGQILVINDVLGISERCFRHARAFMNYRALALKALRAYVAEVERGAFPAEVHVHHIDIKQLTGLGASE